MIRELTKYACKCTHVLKNVLLMKKAPSQLVFPKRNGTLTPRCINVLGCSGKNGFGDS